MTKHTIYIELDLEEGSGRIAEGSKALLAELFKEHPEKAYQALKSAGVRAVRHADDERFLALLLQDCAREKNPAKFNSKALDDLQALGQEFDTDGA